MAADSVLCEPCSKIERIVVAIVRICPTCKTQEMKYGEAACCTICAKKQGCCAWCGKKRSS